MVNVDLACETSPQRASVKLNNPGRALCCCEHISALPAKRYALAISLSGRRDAYGQLI